MCIRDSPCVLADLRDEGVDQGASLRFRVNGGEVRGAEHAADDPRRLAGVHTVSYTHLDVYKRQEQALLRKGR